MYWNPEVNCLKSKESNVPENPFEDEKKQIPQTETTLIYKLFLKKKFTEGKKSEETSQDDTLIAPGAIEEKKEKNNKDKSTRSMLTRVRDLMSKKKINVNVSSQVKL